MAWQCFFVLFSLFHLLFRVNWVMFPYKVFPRGNCHPWVLPCSCMGCGSLSSIRYYTSPNASTLLPICPYCFYYPLDRTPCWLAGVTCLLSVFVVWHLCTQLDKNTGSSSTRLQLTADILTLTPDKLTMVLSLSIVVLHLKNDKLRGFYLIYGVLQLTND